PRALVNCLNFGNPEHADVMWQFQQTVEGIREACEALTIPVIGGNVSFYNESRGADIDPTPIVGVLGLIDRLDTIPPPATFADGQRIVLLGTTRPELGGSEWAARHGLTGGAAPTADLADAGRLHRLVRDLVADREVAGVHDCADGGVAVTLAEMAIVGETGCRVTPEHADLAPAVWCFAESTSRVVLAVDPDAVPVVTQRAQAAGVPVTEIGATGGTHIAIDGACDVPLADAARAWREALPRTLGALD
ncbi:MAG TPA: AIR synthase-related protein, partial [Acidimicrobiia bacterium]|nr:AIR synthase-related protein [Acidimicrobiia bacterium]